MPTANFFQSSPYQIEADRIARNRRMAEALQQESSQGAPVGQMSGGAFIPTSPLTHLAKALQGVNAKKSIEASDRDFMDLSQRRNQALAQALSGMPQASMQAQPTNQEGTGAFDMSGTNVPQRMVQPTMQQNAAWLGNLSNIGPDALQIGSSVLGMQQKSDENALNREARLHERVMALDAASQNAQLAREERAARAQEASALRRELQQSQQEFMAQQSRLSAQDRQAQRAPVAVVGPDGKPVLVSQDQAIGQRPYDKKSGAGLPPTALKMQNEMLEEAAIAGSINSDLAGLGAQLQSGSLQLGPMSNLMSQGRNMAGLSNEQSRNFASFRATLEKLRNDSLRLNKGVQTEGDAQRAWNELISSINDPQVVQQRIGEIQRINQRAADLKRLQIDTMRSNFGMDGMDISPFVNQPAAVGNQGAPQRRSTDDPLGLRKK